MYYCVTNKISRGARPPEYKILYREYGRNPVENTHEVPRSKRKLQYLQADLHGPLALVFNQLVKLVGLLTIAQSR